MVQAVSPSKVDRGVLREQVQGKYTEVALEPQKGFHFHTGRPLAALLGYDVRDVDWLPPSTVESFAGTGNPLALGRLGEGEVVVDIGSGAGFDTLLAARQVGPRGRVIAVDMTEAMLEKTRASALSLGLGQVEARRGFAEELPVETGSVDVVISNGVINLCPDKEAVLREVYRVLRPGGRLQIGDVVLQREVAQDDKDDIELWSG